MPCVLSTREFGNMRFVLVWCSLISGRRGRIEIPPGKRVTICILGCWACMLGVVALDALDAQLGDLVRSFHHRRPLKSILQRTCKFKQDLRTGLVYELVVAVRAEFAIACLYL